ncbi:type 1 glutamine amidotransferase [Phycicoccus elongatus]|jgi:GMP synthase (glutamine-hydrolysing)|uniref:type 1 glutamine amidotransferase n=1 Tax=Phycicoccus elongatus TaxID=101689 RepID=UPI003784EC9E
MTILVIEHEDEAPIGILGERWQEVGHVLDIRRPYLGDDQPAYLGPEHDALVVLGGYMGANDDAEHGWLTQTKALLADTTRRGEQPVLGICLGHQLLTVAMGGVVGRNPSGRAIGLTPIGLTPSGHADPLLTGTDGHDAIQYNDDVALEDPSGAIILARTVDGRTQAARFGPLSWGVQFHPEVTAAIFSAWSGATAEQVSSAYAAEPTLRSTWTAFADRFLALIPSARS